MVREVYMEQRGRSKGVEHNKFFLLRDTGVQVTAQWGAVGETRPIKILCESDDPDVRVAAFAKKYKAKAERGSNPYTVIRDQRNGVDHARPSGAKENRPSSEGRNFGLEIETHTRVDLSTIIDAMVARDLNVNDRRRNYFHSDGTTWDVKRDGSCGYEFASPIMSGEAGVFDSKIAVEKIREISGPNAVNSSCGIHVTVDVRDHSDRDLIRFMIGYLRAQEHFYNKCDASRRTNTYCGENPKHLLPDMIRAGTARNAAALAVGKHTGVVHSDRYYGLNLTRLFDRRCIEFRMLEGTVSIRKIGDWIHTCVGFVDGLKKCGVTFKSTGTFRKDTFDAIVRGEWLPARRLTQ